MKRTRGMERWTIWAHEVPAGWAVIASGCAQSGEGETGAGCWQMFTEVHSGCSQRRQGLLRLHVLCPTAPSDISARSVLLSSSWSVLQPLRWDLQQITEITNPPPILLGDPVTASGFCGLYHFLHTKPIIPLKHEDRKEIRLNVAQIGGLLCNKNAFLWLHSNALTLVSSQIK